ncbi:DUF1000-domain-containing protein [Cristinia sonorae]|uniref:DUF1000-domain-containing protein n=1 Tax=Cristinia sonorae TaxID=1940300 RepID=A0A8K0V0Z2_9AGAR|nr:DUF1000-domain-containing protein [Cristinia sonorae]
MAEEKNDSLLVHMDYTQTNCLNEATEGDNTLRSIIGSKKKNKNSNAYLLSDADEQLLLNINFNQTVRPRSIVIQTSESHIAQGPKRIKLFINRPAIGFEDVEDAEEPEAAQVIELTEEQVKSGKPIPLRFVRFQSVNILHIFVQSNFGDEDVTRIDAVDVLGSATSGGGAKDLSGLQAEEGH